VGCNITAENEVNRHGCRCLYYRCTHKKRNLQCREKALDLVEEERTKDRQLNGGIKEAVQKALDNCQRNLDNLTKLRFRELIREEVFVRERAALTHEEAKLQQRLEQLSAEKWIAPSRTLFLFSNRAKFWLLHGSEAEKRLVLATIGLHDSCSESDPKVALQVKRDFQLLRHDYPFFATCLSFAHLAWAAFFALSRSCSFVSLIARALPPCFPNFAKYLVISAFFTN